MRRVSAAAAAALLGFAALAVAVGVAGARSTQHLTGTNLIRPFDWIVEVPVGRTACQADENVPDGTGAVRLRANTIGRPGPRVEVKVVGAGRGEIPAGWRQGDVVVPIPEIHGDRLRTRVCVTNHGPSRLVLIGESFGPARAARVGREPQPGRARFEYLQPEAKSWWALAPELARRVATVRDAVPGSAALYVWALLGLAVTVGSLLLVVREGRE
jgi:hypothetical protein